MPRARYRAGPPASDRQLRQVIRQLSDVEDRAPPYTGNIRSRGLARPVDPMMRPSELLNAPATVSKGVKIRRLRVGVSAEVRLGACVTNAPSACNGAELYER
jgi:hypothetical protein